MGRISCGSVYFDVCRVHSRNRGEFYGSSSITVAAVYGRNLCLCLGGIWLAPSA